jgi:hypothetical protein
VWAVGAVEAVEVWDVFMVDEGSIAVFYEKRFRFIRLKLSFRIAQIPKSLDQCGSMRNRGYLQEETPIE